MSDGPDGRWRQIEALFHHALERDASERSTFLDAACGGDEALRSDVESLLALDVAAERFLDQPALAEAAGDLADEASHDLTGRRIGGYEVSALLGSGGMGEIYRARDVRLGREVALKVLTPAIAADPAYLRRFEDEARSASVFNHPNIVTIYGVGDEGGLAFIAMELVQGRTLREEISAGPMPMAMVLDVAVQLAGALTAAHASGIVHRDLKPENVMVTPDGRVKVLDFGIARRDDLPAAIPLDQHSLVTKTGLTAAGTIIGTIGYMSPEQATGKLAGFASDQFSFGAIVYELMCGRRAFHRNSKIETLAAIIDGEPEPIERFNPQVPLPLRQVLQRCLAKAPERRFPGARDLELELRRISNAAGVNADTAAGAGPRGFTRRHAILTGGATAVAIAAGALTPRLWSRDTGIRSMAVLPFTNTAGDPEIDYLCNGLAESLIQRISRLPIRVMAFITVLNFKDRTLDPLAAGRELGVKAVLTGTVRKQGSRVLITAELVDVHTGTSLWRNSYDRAGADLIGIQDEIASTMMDEGIRLQLTGEERAQLLRHITSDAEAYELYMKARHFQMRHSEEDYLSARSLLERAVARDQQFSQAFVALAGTYWTSAIDGFARPTEAWPQANKYIQQALQLDKDLPQAHAGAAWFACFFNWNWTDAEREWQTAMRTGALNVDPELLLGYALEQWAVGRADAALRIAQEARRADPVSAIFGIHEANYLFHTGQFDAAAGLYQRVIDTDASDNAGSHFGLAEVRRAQGRFDDAIASRRKGHEVEGDEDLFDLLATAKGEQGYRQVERAAAELELSRLERRDSRGEYASPLDFARAQAQLGDAERALSYFKPAFSDRSPGLVFLKVDPAWASLRNDSRFRDAVEAVGLP